MLSEKLLDDLQKEADALGLKGATAISLAVRAALTERKKVGKVPDERTQTYYVAGRYVKDGEAAPFEGVASVDGLNALASLVDMPPGSIADQIPAARVNLSRKGEAHLQAGVSWHEADERGQRVREWFDLWVFPTEQAAMLMAQSLKPGKIF